MRTQASQRVPGEPSHCKNLCRFLQVVALRHRPYVEALPGLCRLPLQVAALRLRCTLGPCRQATWPSSCSKCALPLQVVALRLRSSGRVGQAPLPEDQEVDYAAKLNRALPPDIKVLGWTTVPEGFSARWGGTACHSSQLLPWSFGPGQG